MPQPPGDIFSRLPWPYILLLLTRKNALIFNCETQKLIRYSFSFNPIDDVIELEDIVVVPYPLQGFNHEEGGQQQQSSVPLNTLRHHTQPITALSITHHGNNFTAQPSSHHHSSYQIDTQTKKDQNIQKKKKHLISSSDENNTLIHLCTCQHKNNKNDNNDDNDHNDNNNNSPHTTLYYPVISLDDASRPNEDNPITTSTYNHNSPLIAAVPHTSPPLTSNQHDNPLITSIPPNLTLTQRPQTHHTAVSTSFSSQHRPSSHHNKTPSQRNKAPIAPRSSRLTSSQHSSQSPNPAGNYHHQQCCFAAFTHTNVEEFIKQYILLRSATRSSSSTTTATTTKATKKTPKRANSKGGMVTKKHHDNGCVEDADCTNHLDNRIITASTDGIDNTDDSASNNEYFDFDHFDPLDQISIASTQIITPVDIHYETSSTDMDCDGYSRDGGHRMCDSDNNDFDDDYSRIDNDDYRNSSKYIHESQDPFSTPIEYNTISITPSSSLSSSSSPSSRPNTNKPNNPFHLDQSDTTIPPLAHFPVKSPHSLVATPILPDEISNTPTFGLQRTESIIEVSTEEILNQQPASSSYPNTPFKVPLISHHSKQSTYGNNPFKGPIITHQSNKMMQLNKKHSQAILHSSNQKGRQLQSHSKKDANNTILDCGLEDGHDNDKDNDIDNNHDDETVLPLAILDVIRHTLRSDYREHVKMHSPYLELQHINNKSPHFELIESNTANFRQKSAISTLSRPHHQPITSRRTALVPVAFHVPFRYGGISNTVTNILNHNNQGGGYTLDYSPRYNFSQKSHHLHFVPGVSNTNNTNATKPYQSTQDNNGGDYDANENNNNNNNKGNNADNFYPSRFTTEPTHPNLLTTSPHFGPFGVVDDNEQSHFHFPNTTEYISPLINPMNSMNDDPFQMNKMVIDPLDLSSNTQSNGYNKQNNDDEKDCQNSYHPADQDYGDDDDVIIYLSPFYFKVISLLQSFHYNGDRDRDNNNKDRLGQSNLSDHEQNFLNDEILLTQESFQVEVLPISTSPHFRHPVVEYDRLMSKIDHKTNNDEKEAQMVEVDNNFRICSTCGGLTSSDLPLSIKVPTNDNITHHSSADFIDHSANVLKMDHNTQSFKSAVSKPHIVPQVQKSRYHQDINFSDSTQTILGDEDHNNDGSVSSQQSPLGQPPPIPHIHSEHQLRSFIFSILARYDNLNGNEEDVENLDGYEEVYEGEEEEVIKNDEADVEVDVLSRTQPNISFNRYNNHYTQISPTTIKPNRDVGTTNYINDQVEVEIDTSVIRQRNNTNTTHPSPHLSSTMHPIQPSLLSPKQRQTKPPHSLNINNRQHHQHIQSQQQQQQQKQKSQSSEQSQMDDKQGYFPNLTNQDDILTHQHPDQPSIISKETKEAKGSRQQANSTNGLISYFNNQSHSYHPLLLLPPQRQNSSSIIASSSSLQQHFMPRTQGYLLQYHTPISTSVIPYFDQESTNEHDCGVNISKNGGVFYSSYDSTTQMGDDCHYDSAHDKKQYPVEFISPSHQPKQQPHKQQSVSNNLSIDEFPPLPYYPPLPPPTSSHPIIPIVTDHTLLLPPTRSQPTIFTNHNENNNNDNDPTAQHQTITVQPEPQHSVSLLQSWTDSYYTSPLQSTRSLRQPNMNVIDGIAIPSSSSGASVLLSASNNDQVLPRVEENLNEAKSRASTPPDPMWRQLNHNNMVSTLVSTQEQLLLDPKFNSAIQIDTDSLRSHQNNQGNVPITIRTTLTSSSSSSLTNNNMNNDDDNNNNHNNDDQFYQQLLEASVPWSHYTTNYKELKHLGRGASGEVVLVQHTLSTFHIGYFAVKKIPLRTLFNAERAIREIRNGEMLQCRYLTLYRHSWLQRAPMLSQMGSTTRSRSDINGGNSNVSDSMNQNDGHGDNNDGMQPFLFMLQQYCHYGGLENVLFPSNQNWIAISSGTEYHKNCNNITSMHQQSTTHLDDGQKQHINNQNYTNPLSHDYQQNQQNKQSQPRNDAILTKFLRSTPITANVLQPNRLPSHSIPFLPPTQRYYNFPRRYPTSFRLPPRPSSLPPILSPPEMTIYPQYSIEFNQYNQYLNELLRSLGVWENEKGAFLDGVVNNSNITNNPSQQSSSNQSNILHPQVPLFGYTASPLPIAPIILSEDLIWIIFIDILIGLAYLHSHGMAHRDIKIENVLLTDDNDSYNRYIRSVKSSRPQKEQGHSSNEKYYHQSQQSTSTTKSHRLYQSYQSHHQSQQPQQRTYPPVYTSIPNLIFDFSSMSSQSDPTQPNNTTTTTSSNNNHLGDIYPASTTTVYTQLHPHDHIILPSSLCHEPTKTTNATMSPHSDNLDGINLPMDEDGVKFNELSGYLAGLYQVDTGSMENNSIHSPLELIQKNKNGFITSTTGGVNSSMMENFKSPCGLTRREELLRIRKSHRGLIRDWKAVCENCVAKDVQGQKYCSNNNTYLHTGNNNNHSPINNEHHLSRVKPNFAPDRLFRFSHALISDFGASMTNFDSVMNLQHTSPKNNDKNNNTSSTTRPLMIGHSGTLQYSSPELLLGFGLSILIRERNKKEITKSSTSLTNQRFTELEAILPRIYTQITSTPQSQSIHPCSSQNGHHKCPSLLSQLLDPGFTLLPSFQEQLQTTESQIQQDMWALGILLYTLAFNHHPFAPSCENNDDDVVGQILALGGLFEERASGDEEPLLNNTTSQLPTITTTRLYFPTYSLKVPVDVSHNSTNNNENDNILAVPRSKSLQLICALLLEPNPSRRLTAFELLSHPIIHAHDFAQRM